MRSIHVERVEKTHSPVEFVERKGLGHPDTICDALGEEVSRAFCKEYLNRYGAVLHHNVDKITLVAGMSSPAFGGGEVISPIYIMLAGRAAQSIDGELFPVQEIAIESCNDYLEKNFFNLNVGTNIDLDSKIGQGSADLSDVFRRRKSEMPLSNDTSFGVGYYPLNELENLVLKAENFLSSDEYRRKNPFVGEDIKVMGLKHDGYYSLTVADAFVGKHLSSLDDYFEAKSKVSEDLNSLISGFSEKPFELFFNNADDAETESVYLTVTGLSAEMGDDGAIGRGNRCNGLITPNRPMSLEAVCGKNPVNHVGKIYNILATRCAEQIVNELGVEEAYVKILSGIGMPIDEPQSASVQLVCDDFESVQRSAFEILDYSLQEIQSITNLFIEGRVKTY